VRLRETGLTWQSVGEDIVVLDLDGSMYLTVNGTGRVLWEELRVDVTVPHLVETLIEHFGVDRTQAETDVEAFVGELRRLVLVTE
jgi:hypothetical protein